MTYYKLYLQSKTETELKSMMERDAKVALFLGSNPDRIKAIEDAGNKVAREKGWTENEDAYS